MGSSESDAKLVLAVGAVRYGRYNEAVGKSWAETFLNSNPTTPFSADFTALELHTSSVSRIPS